MELSDVRCIAVLGLSRSGRPAALLARHELPGVRVVGIDEGVGSSDLIAELADAGVEVLVGEAAALPPQVDLLVKSPGVPNESATVQEALRRGVPLWSEIEFASRFLSNALVGITGTNGKTTTTELLGAILRGAECPVAVGGNIGYALAGMLESVTPESVLVVELSSFQLEHIERFRARVAILLNLAPDHLDRHGTYADYVEAKLRLLENQGPHDVSLLNADDPGLLEELAAIDALGAGRRVWFSARRGAEAGPCGAPLGAGVTAEGELWVAVDGAHSSLCSVEQLALKGEHNVQNSLAAAAAASALGVPADAIARTLRSFEGVPHRLQVVGTRRGVTYINDSKATNVDATLKALTAYSGEVWLILGGYDKGAQYDELARAVCGSVKHVLLVGATAPRLQEAFAACAVAGSGAMLITACGDLATAVHSAAAGAEPGDVVLLSPACASWDQYADYVARGEHFIRLVEELREGDQA